MYLTPYLDAWSCPLSNESPIPFQPHTHTCATGTTANYCSNSLLAESGCAEEKPWCYTTDAGTRWELCDIPMCDQLRTTTAPETTTAPDRNAQFVVVFVLWSPRFSLPCLPASLFFILFFIFQEQTLHKYCGWYSTRLLVSFQGERISVVICFRQPVWWSCRRAF